MPALPPFPRPSAPAACCCPLLSVREGGRGAGPLPRDPRPLPPVPTSRQVPPARPSRALRAGLRLPGQAGALFPRAHQPTAAIRPTAPVPPLPAHPSPPSRSVYLLVSSFILFSSLSPMSHTSPESFACCCLLPSIIFFLCSEQHFSFPPVGGEAEDVRFSLLPPSLLPAPVSP